MRFQHTLFLICILPFSLEESYLTNVHCEHLLLFLSGVSFQIIPYMGKNKHRGHGSQRMRERFSHFRWKSVWGRSSRGECIGISYRSAGQSAGYRSRRRRTSRHRWKHCSRCIKCLVKSSACVTFRSLFHLALQFFISLIDYIDWHW